MKTFTLGFVLVVVFACHQFTQAMTDEEALAVTHKMMEQCIKDAGVTDEEAKLIMADKIDEMDEKNFSANMKCFMLCFYKKLGLIDENNKPNNQRLTEFMTSRFEEHKDKVKPALAKCAAIKDANPCETVYKFELCMTENVEG